MNKTFPTLYEKSGDQVKHWTISVEEQKTLGHNKSIAVIIVKYGKGDSKVRVSEKVLDTGKNIGRSNETTPYQQAISEAESTWKKKLDKGYVEDKADLDKSVLLPMLAHSYTKRGHNIKFPCFVQPKLDGIRCLAKKVDENTIKYYSRMGKEFTTLEHLTPQLLNDLKVGDVVDGEIYSHDLTFQEMIRLVKKLRPESSTLQYHIFDIVDTTIDFTERNKRLEYTIHLNDLIYVVESKLVSCIDDIKLMHSEYIRKGYEGLIIRNADGLYKLNSRSSDLQKYKEFQDEEFKIMNVVEGTGTEAGCAMFETATKDGAIFSVRPRGSFEQRKRWFEDKDNLIGKKLTVRYQELTDDGIPRFSVGISIRDYE